MTRIRIVCRTPSLCRCSGGGIVHAPACPLAGSAVDRGQLPDHTDVRVLAILDDGTEVDIGDTVQSVTWTSRAGHATRAVLELIGAEIDAEGIVHGVSHVPLPDSPTVARFVERVPLGGCSYASPSGRRCGLGIGHDGAIHFDLEAGGPPFVTWETP